MGLGRRLERGLGPGHERVPGWTQERRHAKEPGRHEGQKPERGLVLGLERGPGQRQGQCLVPALVSGPERRQDRRLLRGQGLPELTGG